MWNPYVPKLSVIAAPVMGMLRDSPYTVADVAAPIPFSKICWPLTGLGDMFSTIKYILLVAESILQATSSGAGTLARTRTRIDLALQNARQSGGRGAVNRILGD